MKALRLLPLALGIGLTLAARAADTAAPPARVNVVFDHPENFTDVKDSYLPTDKGRDAILSRIREFPGPRGHPRPSGRRQPDGHIHRYRPRRRVRAWARTAVGRRPHREGYLPAGVQVHIFRNRLVGQGLEAGNREHPRPQLPDARSSSIRADTLRYEKDILKDWMRVDPAGPQVGLKRGRLARGCDLVLQPRRIHALLPPSIEIRFW